MYLGQRITFRSGGIQREGFVTRVIETAKGAMLGSIVSEPHGGSFFVRAHKDNPRNAQNYGLTPFQIDRDMRNNRAAGF